MSSWDAGTSDLPVWDTGTGLRVTGRGLGSLLTRTRKSESAQAMRQYSLLKVLFTFSPNPELYRLS
jgi:hypothetical protein